MTRLHIVNGPNKGQTFDLEGEVYTIGRSPDSDIQIMDHTISRNHLKIFRKNDEYFIEDLNSKNGTFVHGERVKAGIQVALKRGIPLAVGRVFLHLSENIETEYGHEKGPAPEDSAPKGTAPKDRTEKDLEALDPVFEIMNIWHIKIHQGTLGHIIAHYGCPYIMAHYASYFSLTFFTIWCTQPKYKCSVLLATYN